MRLVHRRTGRLFLVVISQLVFLDYCARLIKKIALSPLNTSYRETRAVGGNAVWGEQADGFNPLLIRVLVGCPHL
jgi:hypothetical protein